MNASLSLPVPSARVAPNLFHAFGGVWRLTLRRYLLLAHWLSLGSMLLILVPFSAPVVSTAAEAKQSFMPWIISFYLTFLVPTLAFIAAGGAMRDEMKSSTVDYVLTRPIPRWAFLTFKYIAHVVCTQVDFLLALGVVMAIGWYHDVPGLGDAFPALLGTQLLVVAAFSALGFFGAVVTSRYIIVGLAYGAIIEVGVGQIPTQLSRLSMSHQVQGMLHRFVPPDPKAVLAEIPVLPPTSIIGTVGLLVAFSIIMVALAAAIFSWLELIGREDA